MFIGEYTHSIDDKGRLSVPSKFREDLSHGAIVTRGLDGCLSIYTRKEWEVLAERLSKLPLSNKQGRAFARLMLAGAWDVMPDSQGRINIPEQLIKYAGITKHAVVAGLYNRLEVWDEDSWHTFRDEAEGQSADLAEALSELGI